MRKPQLAAAGPGRPEPEQVGVVGFARIALLDRRRCRMEGPRRDRSVLRMRMLLWVCGGLLVAASATAIAFAPAGSGRREDQGRTPPPEAAAPVTMEEVAIRAVRARLRSPEAAEFLDLHVFRFGPEDERAVCGRMRPGKAPADVSADFVVRILLPRPVKTGGGRIMTVLEDGPGIPRPSGDDARRRYCRDGSAPPPAEPSGTMDAAIPVSTATGSGTPDTAALGGGGPAPHMVVVRSPANLRTGPGGGATVLRTAARGEAFRVHGYAPGGWVQVGDMEHPRGWVHSSLLEEARP